MIYCPVCGISNRDGSRFCNDCGTSLAAAGPTCPNCQARNPSTSRFCGLCGAFLQSHPGAAWQDGQVLVEPPPALAESEDDLPSLEADVPIFPAFDFPVSTPPPVDHALPGWLDLSERAAAEAPPAQLADQPSQIGLLPGWLDLQEEQVILPEGGIGTWPTEIPPGPEAPELPAWLQIVEPAPALPDWLNLAEPAPDTLPFVPPPQMVLPDWLALPESASTTSSPQPPPQLALPDWLTVSEPPPSQLALPDWLTLPESPVPSQLALPGWLTLPERVWPSEIPDWLTMPEPEASLPASAQPSPLALPEWLALPGWLSLSDSLEEKTASGQAATSAGLPSWLFLREPEQPPLEDGLAVSRSLPDWLDLADVALIEPLQKTLPFWLDLPEPATRVLPAWLLSQEEEVPRPAIAPLAVEPEPPAVKTAERVYTPALPGIIMARPLRAPERPTKQSVQPLPTPDYEALFADILHPAQKAEPAAAPSLPLQRGFRFISFLLLIVVLVPLFFPLWINVEAQESTTNVFKTIQALPPTANVLVSFDWTAGAYDEMSPIAEAIIRHLVRRKVRIVAMSLIPEGAKLAQVTLDKVVLPKTNGYVYGDRVVNLGYLPGDEAAIQSLSAGLAKSLGVDYFGTPAGEMPMLKEIKSVTGIDLVVELSSEPDMLRKWITQLSPRYPGIRMVAGLSAMSSPWAQTFSSGAYGGQTQQLKGIVTGIRGAAEYEWMSNDPNDHKPKPALAALDAQSLGAVFLALVIVLGNLASLRGRLGRARRSGSIGSRSG